MFILTGKMIPFAHALLPVDFETGGNYASKSYFKKALMKSHFITKAPTTQIFSFWLSQLQGWGMILELVQEVSNILSETTSLTLVESTLIGIILVELITFMLLVTLLDGQSWQKQMK